MVTFFLLAGDDLADWCLQIYRDFKEEHQEELKEEARAGRESQMQRIHLKFPKAPELEALRHGVGSMPLGMLSCWVYLVYLSKMGLAKHHKMSQ